VSLVEWITGAGAKIGIPTQLDLFLRANNASASLGSLFVPPIMLPTYIMNPSGFSPIIEYYDRNPINRTVNVYLPGIGPHGGTQRWLYTCPANRKALVHRVFGRVIRRTAAANPFDAEIEVYHDGNGPFLRAVIWTNAVNDQDSQTLTALAYVGPGGTLQALSYDNSVGGTVDYEMTYSLTEFDA